MHPSPYGTFDQGGNVSEWNDTIISSSARVMRGGQFSFFSSFLDSSTRQSPSPSGMGSSAGFRVASVPEPGTLSLLGILGVCLGGYAWRKRRRVRA
ncbi:MAG: SUMF1/EgtB/PvdO family nonheme iron enzyme [Pirellulales bacterium]|nr:SUMF1/EgtB/PvdO family nonheme iron enzyme [Pirellulales bacterium]